MFMMYFLTLVALIFFVKINNKEHQEPMKINLRKASIVQDLLQDEKTIQIDPESRGAGIILQTFQKGLRNDRPHVKREDTNQGG